MASNLGEPASPAKRGDAKACKFVMFFLVFLVYMTHETSAMKTDDAKDVSRISYGVNFKFIKEMTSICGFWYHSVVQDLPGEVFNNTRDQIILGDKSDQPRRKWLDDCLLYHDNDVMNTPEQNSDLPTNVTNPRTLCMKFGPMIKRLLRNLHSDQKLIAEQVRSIRDLTPPDMLKAVKRGRRGWFDGIGSVFHEVFGVATDKQIATVEDHVKQIAGLFQSQTAVYKKSIHELSSFNKDVNDRFGNMAKAISDNAPNQPVGVGKTLGRCPSPRRAIYEDRHLIDIILLIGCTLAQSPLYDVGAIAARRRLDVDSLESICRW